MKNIPAEDRWGLQNDLYASVRSCDAPFDDYLEFLSNYSDEDAFLPAAGIASNLFHAFSVLEGEKQEQAASTGRSLFEGMLSRIGYEPSEDENHSISILRDQIIFHAVLYNSREAREYSFERFEMLLEGQAIHPDIMKSIMQTGASCFGDDAYRYFTERLLSSDSEHERMNILIAMGWFTPRELLVKARQYILSNVPARNKFVPIISMTANPHSIPGMWEWYVSNIPELEKLHPLHYERVIEGIVPLCGLGREEEVRVFFKKYLTQNAKAEEVIKLSLERLEINSRMRRYNSSKAKMLS